jgi:hypothetical protein
MPQKRKPGKPARKVKETTREYEEPIVNDEPLEEDFSPSIPVDDTADAIHRLMSNIGSTTWAIKVSRMTAGGYAYKYTHRPEMGEFDEEKLQQRFPQGGKFLCKFYDTRTSPAAFVDAREILIDPAPMTENPNGPVMSPEFQILANEIRDLKTVMADGRGVQREATPVGELAEAVKAVVSLAPQPQAFNPTEMFTQFMGAFMKGFDMAKDMKNPPAPETDWKTELFKTIGEIAPGVVHALRPSPAPNGHAQEVPALQEAPEVVNEQQLRQVIAGLKHYAKNDTDPDLIIEWVRTPGNAEPYWPVIREALNKEFDAFASLDPEIQQEPFRSWFKRLYDGLRSAFSGGNPVADDSDGESGNGGNS